MSVQILQGDVRQQLATLPSESVQVVCTSPPYFGLRAYGTNPQVWGGDPEHAHVFGDETVRQFTAPAGSEKQASNAGACSVVARSTHCPCGAWRGELGSEPTPALFIEHLVSIFDAVGRVMRPDGVLFVNLGDSYAGSGKGPTGKNGIGDQSQRQGFHDEHKYSGVKAKSLLLIPERFSIAMQDAGWIVRSRIAWCKTSAMPESVRDRPTSAWEHVWMFTKQARYFWDQDAVRQAPAASTIRDTREPRSAPAGWSGNPNIVGVKGHPMPTGDGGANLRNYWLLGPEPSKEQHYAAFPSEIPRRCILAATSERGQCPACGAPWVRVVERDNNGLRRSVGGKNAQLLGMSRNDGYRRMGDVSSNTLGWSSSCGCNAGPPTPQLVLDPFLGSGTTALVADQLGRNAVGVELNPEYAEMARRRITNSCPMFTDVEVAG